jgi:hypothetical protein
LPNRSKARECALKQSARCQPHHEDHRHVQQQVCGPGHCLEDILLYTTVHHPLRLWRTAPTP